jgi:hypothetical protein
MYLLINKTTKQILLSSARAIDPSQYEGEDVQVAEIPDSEYSPEMVGGILHTDE